MKTKRITKPCDAKTFKQVEGLPSDNMDGSEGWILLGAGTVTLANQKNLEPLKAQVEFSRKTFKRFCEWYLGTKPLHQSSPRKDALVIPHSNERAECRFTPNKK